MIVVMSARAHAHPSRRRVHTAAAAIVGTLLLAVSACSADGGEATLPTTAAPISSAPAQESMPPRPRPEPPTSTEPSTSAEPPTSAAPPATPAVDEARVAQLRDILESHRAAGEFVGARIALRAADGAVTEVVAGTTSVDPASGPVDPAVAWNIGSATKSFVAVVALQLVDEGRLDLDAPIDSYFPELPGADTITPRQLLQHTSGLGEYLDDPAVQGDLARAWTPDELIAVAEAAGRIGEPGGPHRYTNTNYIVLGELIERVTGNGWADEVRTRIAEPLGMTATGELGDHGPVGYRVVDGTLVDWTDAADPSVGGAAGGLQSTGRDLLLFATALRDGTLLSPQSQAAMQAFVPAEDLSQFGIEHGYGLGLERYTLDGITVIGHMGTGEAQSAYVGYDAGRGTVVAVTTNTAIPGPAAIMAVEALLAVGQGG